jgi:DNA-binding transcriptional LysR family regulator
VSNALARLRGAFGDALFVRTVSGMEPTPFARGLAEPVRAALDLLELALAHGAGFDPASATRAFRFYMSDIGESYFLPPLVEALQRLAPAVRLEAVPMEPDDIPEALATGAIEVAVGFLPGLGAPLRRKRLFRDPYVCMVRADHPRIGDSLTRGVFREASHALVSSMGSGHRVIEEALERNGLTRRVALRVPHFTAIPTVLERSDLILTLPERIARAWSLQGRLKLLKPPVAIPPADVAVHWHPRFDREPGNLWLRARLHELFTD